MNYLTEIGVGGIFALMVLNLVLPYFKRGTPECTYSQICKLRHDNLEGLIKAVNENISAQTVILRELCIEITKIKERLP